MSCEKQDRSVRYGSDAPQQDQLPVHRTIGLKPQHRGFGRDGNKVLAVKRLDVVHRMGKAARRLKRGSPRNRLSRN